MSIVDREKGIVGMDKMLLDKLINNVKWHYNQRPYIKC